MKLLIRPYDHSENDHFKIGLALLGASKPCQIDTSTTLVY